MSSDNLIKIGYIVIGILIAVLFITNRISETMETVYAYKNPAKIMKNLITELKIAKLRLKQQRVEMTEMKKELDIAIKGNAKVEKRPDGTEIITGDNITIGTKEDKKNMIDDKKDEGLEETTKTKAKGFEETTPIFKESENYIAIGIETNTIKTFGLSGSLKLDEIIFTGAYYLDASWRAGVEKTIITWR